MQLKSLTQYIQTVNKALLPFSSRSCLTALERLIQRPPPLAACKFVSSLKCSTKVQIHVEKCLLSLSQDFHSHIKVSFHQMESFQPHPLAISLFCAFYSCIKNLNLFATKVRKINMLLDSLISSSLFFHCQWEISSFIISHQDKGFSHLSLFQCIHPIISELYFHKPSHTIPPLLRSPLQPLSTSHTMSLTALVTPMSQYHCISLFNFFELIDFRGEGRRGETEGERKERERNIETLVCYSSFLCIYWLLLVCALARDRAFLKYHTSSDLIKCRSPSELYLDFLLFIETSQDVLAQT